MTISSDFHFYTEGLSIELGGAYSSFRPDSAISTSGYFQSDELKESKKTNALARIVLDFKVVESLSEYYNHLNIDSQIEAKISVFKGSASFSKASTYTSSRTSFTFAGFGKIDFQQRKSGPVRATNDLITYLNELVETKEIKNSDKIEFLSYVGDKIVTSVNEGISFSVIFNIVNVSESKIDELKSAVTAQYASVNGKVSLDQIIRDIDETAFVKAHIEAPFLTKSNKMEVEDIIKRDKYDVSGALSAVSKMIASAAENNKGYILSFNTMDAAGVPGIDLKSRRVFRDARKLLKKYNSTMNRIFEDIIAIDQEILGYRAIERMLLTSSKEKKEVSNEISKRESEKDTIVEKLEMAEDVSNITYTKRRRGELPVFYDYLPDNFIAIDLIGWRVQHVNMWAGPHNSKWCVRKTIAYPRLVFDALKLIEAIRYSAKNGDEVLETGVFRGESLSALVRTPYSFAERVGFLATTSGEGHPCSEDPYYIDGKNKVASMAERIRSRQHEFTVYFGDYSKKTYKYDAPTNENIVKEVLRPNQGP